MLAEEVLPHLGRVPKNISGRPLAWLGAYGMEPMDRDVAKFLKLEAQSGAVVSEVLEGSPAEKAGVKGGDTLVKLGDVDIDNIQDFTSALRMHKPGDALDIVVLREKERLTFKVTLGRR